jgi:DDE superfamily endonuclease
VVQRTPRLFGLVRSRWWLDGLRQAVDWLRPLSCSGVWRLLRRLRLRYKRGRRYVHSPDPAYDRKLARIHAALGLARWNPARYVVLYEDELTYYLRPTVAQGYAPVSADAPRAEQGWGTNRTWRIAGSLNALTGQHHAQQAEHFDRHTLLAYLRQLEAAYPTARRIFVVLDNWPVHFHPDLLAGLAGSRIRLLPLPTYAPWTNPEEKVWRKGYAELFHLHDGATRWPAFKLEVQSWLDHVDDDRHGLLRSVGLCPT